MDVARLVRAMTWAARSDGLRFSWRGGGSLGWMTVWQDHPQSHFTLIYGHVELILMPPQRRRANLVRGQPTIRGRRWYSYAADQSTSASTQPGPR